LGVRPRVSVPRGRLRRKHRDSTRRERRSWHQRSRSEGGARSGSGRRECGTGREPGGAPITFVGPQPIRGRVSASAGGVKRRTFRNPHLDPSAPSSSRSTRGAFPHAPREDYNPKPDTHFLNPHSVCPRSPDRLPSEPSGTRREPDDGHGVGAATGGNGRVEPRTGEAARSGGWEGTGGQPGIRGV
jgi:hypothetical protein